MEVGSDDEEVAFATFRFFIRRCAEVKIECAFGGFVEFLRIEKRREMCLRVQVDSVLA